MGYDMYAIKPEHDVADPLNDCELLRDPWYSSKTHGIRHPIFHAWRARRTDGGAPIPDDLHSAMLCLSDTPTYAKDTAAEVELLARSVTPTDMDLLHYAHWIRHWADKGACFHLSR